VHQPESRRAKARYNRPMPLKDIDFDGVFRRLAERRIEEVIKEGKFSNLPGEGQPIELETERQRLRARTGGQVS
jgi:hypothetical protein